MGENWIKFPPEYNIRTFGSTKERNFLAISAIADGSVRLRVSRVGLFLSAFHHSQFLRVQKHMLWATLTHFSTSRDTHNAAGMEGVLVVSHHPWIQWTFYKSVQ